MTSPFAALACSVGLASAVALAGPSLHISPSGDDTAPGAAQSPVRTLAALQKLINSQPGVTEVVFHAGVYAGSLVISETKEKDAAKPLLVRSAGDGEVILDGGLPLKDAEAVAGAPGVYRVPAERFLSAERRRAGRMPGMWDAAARRRYTLVADATAVARFPATYAFATDFLYVHTHDGQSPGRLNIEVSSLDVASSALTVNRANVTVRGLGARGFHGNFTSSAGFEAKAANVTFEDCRVFNCPRGFRASGPNVRVLRCRADDCGGGVLINSKGALVEDCVLIRNRDAFMSPMPLQEDTGVEIYHPAGDNITVRRNVAKGYTFCGVFIKCSPGVFRVERNTLIENAKGLGWSPSPGKQIVFESNIAAGGGIAVDGQTEDSERVELKASDNVIWPGPWGDMAAWNRNAAYLNKLGKGNNVADPRFAAPEKGDYRLAPDSPCLRGGKPVAGALDAAPADFRDPTPPQARLDEQPAMASRGQDATGRPLFVAKDAAIGLRVQAYDGFSPLAEMRVRVGGSEWSKAMPFAAEAPVKLPAAGDHAVSVQVSNAAGLWSEPATITVRVGQAAPALAGKAVVRANEHGVVISFETNVECLATGAVGAGKTGAALIAHGVAPGAKPAPSRQHALSAPRPKGAAGRVSYRVQLASDTGAPGAEIGGEFEFAGQARQIVVDPAGNDAEDGGSEARPWRTLQYAVDRALPGDRVVLRPGLYAEPALIVRGGAEGAPLVIAAQEQWKAVLDGQRQVPELIRVAGAPRVEIEGLEMRWYGDPYGAAIRIEKSPSVTVRGCRIWNAFWHEGRATGTAITAEDSPGFTLERSLLFRNDHAFSLERCPRSRIVFNTIRGHVHGGLGFNESVAGTTLRNNCLTYNGNYTLQITVADFKEMETFDSDYNNLGGKFRDWRDEPGAAPNLPGAGGSGKRLVYFARKGGTWLLPTWPEKLYPPAQDLVIRKIKTDPKDPRWVGKGELQRIWLPDATTPPEQRGGLHWGPATFEDWKAFSGLDKHSIFADPKHTDRMEFDFTLLPDSPNIGAGENGATIGAMPVKGKARK